MTSWGTPNISSGLHTNISLLHQRKSMSSPSYLGFRLAPIWTVLAGSSTSIYTALASSATLKALDDAGMVGPVKGGDTWRHNSLSLVVVTMVAASSMLFYS
jgi:hypothetical protein